MRLASSGVTSPGLKDCRRDCVESSYREEAWSLYLELDAISNELESVRQEAMYLAGAADYENLSK